MTVVLLKQTPIGKMATSSTRAAADALVAAGKALHDPMYRDIYEAITDGEIAQGFMTRNHMTLPPKAQARHDALTTPHAAGTGTGTSTGTGTGTGTGKP
jgi:hypothetical protein